jgi:hypothetical protein
MVEALESVVKRRPKLGRSIARNTFAWPAMISRNRALIKENEKLIQTLELGKNGVFSAGGRQLSARSTLAALKLFTIGQWRVADGLCSTLTKKNKKRWFDENWKWLVSEVCQPEDTKFFRPLGESKAKRKPKYCKQLHPATQRANIRSEIKTKVWRAFDEIITPTK